MDKIETIQEEVKQLRKDVDRLKRIIEDEGELNEKTLKAIEETRTTPESEYVDFE